MKSLFYRFVAVISVGFLLNAFLLNAHAGEANKSIFSLLVEGNAAEEFLPPDVAFKLNLNALDAENIQATFTVAPGYYLYRERIKFVIPAANAGKPSTAQVATITLPAGEIKDDPNFGKQEVYHHDFKANIKLANISGNEVIVAATYQGCSEKGLCYAPIKKTIAVNLNEIMPSGANISAETNDTDDATTGLLKTGNLWLIIAGFFGAGLLLSMTPCVLPMIPILSSIIVGKPSQTAHASKLHNFSLSVAYVLGMALSYTLAGVAAGLSGNLLSQSLQNPWVLGSSALVFVLLACSMFGFYEIKLPDTFEDKVLSASNKLKGGKFLGVFVMGVLSALIVSPCVAAPLAGALIYISQSQDVILGATALFALSLGMGVPLLLIGASAGSLLPKTGNWMNTVRNFFGVLMLGMAIWLVSPVIPVGVRLALWAALLIVTAIYLNALDRLPEHHDHFAKFWKGIAIILLVFGVALLVGALSGAKSALQPLSFIASSTQQQAVPTLNFTRVSSVAELDKKLAEVKGQPVMLDFYADWCVACKEFEEFTFSDQKVQQLLKNTVLLQADVTANSEADVALLKRFALYGPPGIIFFDKNGQEITSVKTVGFQNAERFTATLNKRASQL
ncbi:MAG TPA: protein-disulfide reductase DsbD [Methylotenera sp.]|nr:protein-disulfide reductase DsbD [Methylotenera sp.]